MLWCDTCYYIWYGVIPDMIKYLICYMIWYVIWYKRSDMNDIQAQKLVSECHLYHIPYHLFYQIFYHILYQVSHHIIYDNRYHIITYIIIYIILFNMCVNICYEVQRYLRWPESWLKTHSWPSVSPQGEGPHVQPPIALLRY